ncbi:MAG: electron transfer flavoprotein subunit beta/FixA family protein [Betaproteobacteria bacterium]|nr:electron transfer flavoprotein subunit beta/FixA family protein [Desulfovibrionaceae bacterium]MCL1985543.1 electron transfer flavoprotein subunit beta/FixA family protein [Betaproteobacteria bacterium]
MKKIAVCYKWVLSDADIRINERTRELDMEKCKPQINEYDRMGLETGVRLKEASGCELVALTCGAATEASAKDALSRGPDAVYCLDDPVMAVADATATSKVLAAMIRSISDVDVVICSEGSSDQYAQQVGPRLAALLGFTSVSYVSKAEVQGDALLLERKLEQGTECVKVIGPVVVSIVPDICEAPIPSVKQILAAKKKPSIKLGLADIGLSADSVAPLLHVAGVKAPLSERKAVRLNPDGVSISEAATALARQLAADGIL